MKSEEHRRRAISALLVAFTDDEGREHLTRREAEEIVDHIAAHAVETVRDLIAAEERAK